MEKQTVFIKRYPSKGELPIESGVYITNLESLAYSEPYKRWFDFNKDLQWWLEEIELPSEVDIIIEADKIDNWKESYEFERGANFILNHLKSNTNVETHTQDGGQEG